MARPFVVSRRVEFSDTDCAGIAHFSSFFLYMEQAEHALLRSLGLSVSLATEEGRLSWPRVAAECQYKSAVKFEDLLEISVRLERLGEKSATYAFAFTHEGRDVASGRMTSVCCRMLPDQPPQATPIPGWIAEKLATHQG